MSGALLRGRRLAVHGPVGQAFDPDPPERLILLKIGLDITGQFEASNQRPGDSNLQA